MAYYATGPCLICRRPFMFNPVLVPSHPWPPPNGPKQPICKTCVRLINEQRRQAGRDPFPVPDGAYAAADGIPD